MPMRPANVQPSRVGIRTSCPSSSTGKRAGEPGGEWSAISSRLSSTARQAFARHTWSNQISRRITVVMRPEV